MGIERFLRIYDDKSGDYIQVGPDRDGLDMIELTDRSSPNVSFVLKPETAREVARAILELVDGIQGA
jgi:hypothetical protein